MDDVLGVKLLRAAHHTGAWRRLGAGLGLADVRIGIANTQSAVFKALLPPTFTFGFSRSMMAQSVSLWMVIPWLV